MHVAKLANGKIVQVLRFNVSVAFNCRPDNVLIATPVGVRGYRQTLKWINTTQVVWHHVFKSETTL